MAYLTAEGTALNVNWEQATHVTFLAGRVASDGTVDLSAGETNQRMDELVARGHIAGRAVLLGLAGRLSPVDGWALYEANDFGRSHPHTRLTRCAGGCCGQLRNRPQAGWRGRYDERHQLRRLCAERGGHCAVHRWS